MLAASARRVNFPKHQCVPGRTRSGASAVPKHDSHSGTKQRRPDPTIPLPIRNWYYREYEIGVWIAALEVCLYENKMPLMLIANSEYRRACNVTNSKICVLLSKQDCINWSFKKLVDHHIRIIHWSLWYIHSFIFYYLHQWQRLCFKRCNVTTSGKTHWLKWVKFSG